MPWVRFGPVPALATEATRAFAIERQGDAVIRELITRSTVGAELRPRDAQTSMQSSVGSRRRRSAASDVITLPPRARAQSATEASMTSVVRVAPQS